MQDWRVCAGGEGRVALSSRRVGKPIHVHARRELLAAAPASPSVHINSPGDRPPCEPLMLFGAAVWRRSPCVTSVATQADQLRSRRTTILPSLCVKRQQLNKLKQHESHHAQVDENHQQMSCSARASRASESWSGAPERGADAAPDRTREHR